MSWNNLGVWISHGEGKFNLPEEEEDYNIVLNMVMKDIQQILMVLIITTAMLCDKTGRHLVTMPHIERSIFQWNWANYIDGRQDEVSPWLEAFVNARKWIENN